LSAQTQAAFDNVRTRIDGLANLGNYLGLFTTLPTNFSQLPAGASRNDFITLQTGTAPNVMQQRYVLTTSATSGAIAAGDWRADVIYNTTAVPAHQHNASDINAGTLPIARGGTGVSATSIDQIQADWNQATTSDIRHIRNKPTIPTVSDTTFSQTTVSFPA
jgi:hypothetical protein